MCVITVLGMLNGYFFIDGLPMAFILTGWLVGSLSRFEVITAVTSNRL